jgi:hypothetical protein
MDAEQTSTSTAKSPRIPMVDAPKLDPALRPEGKNGRAARSEDESYEEASHL